MYTYAVGIYTIWTCAVSTYVPKLEPELPRPEPRPVSRPRPVPKKITFFVYGVSKGVHEASA